MPNILASHHCCAIYEMEGVQHSDPTQFNIQSLIEKTKWNGRTCKIIQFSDTPGYGGGDKWMKHLIKLGYRVDKFEIGINPKTQNTVFLYNWFVTPKTSEEKAAKLSIVREYSYEQQEKERPNPEPAKSGVSQGRRTFRDRLGRFRSSCG